MISVVDYGRGNIFSILAALQTCGASFELTEDPDRLLGADRIVLPGVGAFGDAAAGLRRRGLWEAIREAARRGCPLLGICLGMQLLADRGEEFGQHEGLGLVQGVTRRLPNSTSDEDGVRIPNVGWRPLSITQPHPVLAGVSAGDMMYFVHSYGLAPEAPDTLFASIRCNGSDVAAVVAAGNVIGCQFHPERSGPKGLSIIQGFVDWKP